MVKSLSTMVAAVLACVACLLSPQTVLGGGGGRIKHSTKTLRKTRCAKSEKVKRGDEVRILLSAGSETLSGETYKSDGAAEQKFIVGRHRIPPINKGIVGMCVGDVRRVRVSVEQVPGAPSDPLNYVVELLSSSGGPPRVKEDADL